MRRALRIAALSASLAFAYHLDAQGPPEMLSNAEIEELRDSAPLADLRVATFQRFLQERITRIEKLSSGPRHAGREEDIHDLMEQFTGIAHEFEDNLGDYDEARRDIRKAVPKLLKAIEKWEETLKKPPADDAYKVSRTLALEALTDLRDQANETLSDENTWFATHKPTVEPSYDGPSGVL